MSTPESTFDFTELPAPARAAFVRAVTEGRTPLASKSSGGYLLAGITGAIALAVIMYWGYGDPLDSMSSQGPISLVIYLAGFAGLIGAVSLYKGHKATKALLGFTPGVYALGSRLIDARKRRFGVYDLFAHDPKIVHRYVNGGYRHTTLTWHGHSFVFGRQHMAGQALEQLNVNLAALRKALADGNIDLMLVLDPIGVGLALAKSEREAGEPKPVVPAPSRKPLAIFALATLALGTSAFFVRNYASVEAAYGRIYNSYIADAWMDNGGDRARGERKKMELELREATDTAHADKMREVLAHYPDAPAELRKPVEDALRARYEAARKASLALSSSEPLTAFINQVYDQLENKGVKSVMQIEVARTDNSALAKLDAEVAGDPKLAKTIVPVAKYFDGDDVARTHKLTGAIQSGLAQFFPADVMELAETGDKDEAKIEIFYVIRPKLTADGYPSLYSEIDDKGKPVAGSVSYPGIEFELGATLEVPGGKEPQRVTFTARPAPTISVEHLGPGENADNSAVYHAMANSAFADLETKLVAALGGRPIADKEPEPAPTDPACDALEQKIAKLDACGKLGTRDRAKLDADLDKLVDDKSLETGVACKKAAVLVDRALSGAKCNK